MAEANGSQPHTVQLSNILLGSKSGTVNSTHLLHPPCQYTKRAETDRMVHTEQRPTVGKP